MDYYSLTGRQRRVLELLASGKTNKEIAAALHISVNTVEYHLTKRIYPLLGVRSRSAASAVYFKLATRATEIRSRHTGIGRYDEHTRATFTRGQASEANDEIRHRVRSIHR